MGQDRPGSYLLFIALDGPVRLKVGALGEQDFPAGTYIYCGSALNGLHARVARHLRPERKAHWHVDHLLAQGQPVGALLVYSEARLECRLAEKLSRLEGVRRHVPGFGASDCRCPGHLLLCEEPVQAVGGAIQGVLNGLQDGPLEQRQGQGDEDGTLAFRETARQ